jgi:hypothetical protein
VIYFLLLLQLVLEYDWIVNKKHSEHALDAVYYSILPLLSNVEGYQFQALPRPSPIEMELHDPFYLLLSRITVASSVESRRRRLHLSFVVCVWIIGSNESFYVQSPDSHGKRDETKMRRRHWRACCGQLARRQTVVCTYLRTEKMRGGFWQDRSIVRHGHIDFIIAF